MKHVLFCIDTARNLRLFFEANAKCLSHVKLNAQLPSDLFQGLQFPKMKQLKITNTNPNYLIAKYSHEQLPVVENAYIADGHLPTRPMNEVVFLNCNITKQKFIDTVSQCKQVDGEVHLDCPYNGALIKFLDYENSNCKRLNIHCTDRIIAISIYGFPTIGGKYAPVNQCSFTYNIYDSRVHNVTTLEELEQVMFEDFTPMSE